MIAPGQTIRGYEVKEQIASEGFGAVFRALQLSVGREVAIKVILPQYASDPQFIRRFEIEAQLVARLEHRAIVPLYDYWRDSSGAYLVMRWLRGGDLRDSLREGPWSLEKVARLVDQIAAGLAKAHAQGIVHRDIKPANILLDQEGNAYLSDFGIAKDLTKGGDSTQSGSIVGSLAYISPEQIRGETVTPQADLYSLGLVIYELLSGEPAFAESSPSNLIYKQLSERVPSVIARRPEIPIYVDEVIQQATTKDVANRFPDARSMAAAFRLAAAELEEMHYSLSREATDPAHEVAGEVPGFLKEGELDVSPNRPVFVARERELALLDEHLAGVMAGHGRTVFVNGEAGQGKSALLNEFARRGQEKYGTLIVARGNCDAFTGVGDPYLPFRDVLGMFCGDVEAKWSAGAITFEEARRLISLFPLTIEALVSDGPDLIDIFVPALPLQKRAVSALAWDEPILEKLADLVQRQQDHPADLEQRQVFEQYTQVLHTLSNRQPLLLLLDDLQWADGASVSLLFHLGRRLPGSSILLVGAYRPSEVSAGRLPGSSGSAHDVLEPVINEFRRIFGDIQLDLDQVATNENQAFIDDLLDSEPNALNEIFRARLFRRTKGHPLFTVELLRDMQARGDLHKNEQGTWVEGSALDWETLPARVEAVIEQRVGRLEKELKEILAVASVEGEEFTAEVIASIREIDRRPLVRRLSSDLDKQHHLVLAQGIKRVRAGRLSLYRFRHSLFQKYLYDSLDEVERSILHEEIANRLLELYEEETDEIAVHLARHFEEAGIPERAIDYLFLAGKKAIQLSAHSEAIAHLRKGLVLLQRVPSSADRDRQELVLLLALGVPLQVTKGPGATEVGDTYIRARELYYKVGRANQLYPALWGLWRFYRSRAEFQIARELADELLSLTQEQDDPALILQGHHAQWTTLIYLGEFNAALEHVGQGLALYSPQRHHSDASLFSGHDLGVCAHTMASYSLWALGFPDQALDRANAALALAVEFSHPPSFALAYEHLSGLYRFRKEPGKAQARAQDLITLASEQGYEYDLATGRVLLGWSLVEQGQSEEGMVHVREGLDTRRPGGTGLEDTHFTAILAEVLSRIGHYDEANQLVVSLLETVEKTNQRFWEAELYRLKGESLLNYGESKAEAETAFQQSLAVARRQHAKSLELRAALSLYKLWDGGSQHNRGLEVLADIYGWFTEGFETPDLLEARLLLNR